MTRSTTRRIGRVLLEISAGILVLLAVASAVLAWRLSQGPVRVDALTPYISAAAENLVEGTKITTGPTYLAWEGWPQTVSLLVEEVEMRGPDGTLLLSLPLLGAQLSFGALFSGKVAPTQLTAYDARLRFERQEDGSIVFDSALPEQPSFDLTRVLPDLLQDLLQSPDPQRPITYLETLQIVDAQAVMADRRLKTVWTMPRISAELTAVSGGLSGVGTLDIKLGDNLLRADLELDYREEDGLVETELAVADLRPSWLGELIPGGKALTGVDVPLGGVIWGNFRNSGELVSLGFDLAAEGGSLDLPEYFPEPLALARLDLRGGLYWESGTFELDLFELALAETPWDGAVQSPTNATPWLTGSVLVEEFRAAPRVQLVARAGSVTAEALNRLWPLGLAPPSREWVTENIRGGIAESGEIEVDLRLPRDFLKAHRNGETPAPEFNLLEGRIDYRGVEVQYLEGLPPVTAVEGHILFDEKTFRVYPQSGRLREARGGPAELVITGLDGPDQAISMTIPVRGPLREAIEVIDQPRLDFASKIGVEPGMVEGWAEGDLSFAFPLERDLTFDDVEMLIEGELTDVRVAGLLRDFGAEAEALDLTVTEDGMHVLGPLRFAGVPAHVDWRENFHEDAELSRHAVIEIPAVEVAALDQLGLPFGSYVSGALRGNLEIFSRREESFEVQGDFDLEALGLDVSPLGLAKEEGEEGWAAFHALREEGQAIELADLRLRIGEGGGRFALRGRGELSAEGRVERLEFSDLRNGESRFESVSVVQNDAAWLVEINGGALDLEPLLPVIRAQDEGEAEQTTAIALSIQARNLAQIRFDSERWLEAVSLSAERDAEGRWWKIDLDAEVPAELSARQEPEDRQLTLRYGPAGGLKHFSFVTQDAGGALRVMGISEGLRGGVLHVSGSSREADPDGPIFARIEGGDLVAVDAPILAQILSLGSLTGLGNTLSGEGIRFDRIEGDLELDQSRLWSDLIRIYGPALGLTVEGEVDIGNEVDLEGTVVPIYSVNRVLGSIPILGQIITGGEGEGVFALTYRVRGDLDDPQVTVNPLAALAPGFLRTLFGVFSDGPTQREGAPQGQDRPTTTGRAPRDPNAQPPRSTDDPTRQR